MVHCIDASSASPVQDYEIIRQEFSNYNEVLLEKKEIILLTKADLVDEGKLKDIIKELQPKTDRIYTITVYDDASVSEFKKELLKLYNKS